MQRQLDDRAQALSSGIDIIQASLQNYRCPCAYLLERKVLDGGALGILSWSDYFLAPVASMKLEPPEHGVLK